MGTGDVFLGATMALREARGPAAPFPCADTRRDTNEGADGHVAAAGLPLLTLPDSLGLATKTKVPGAFLDVALVAAAAVQLVRRRRGQPSREPSVRAPAATGQTDRGTTRA